MADENKEDELVIVEVDEEGKAPEPVVEEGKETKAPEPDADEHDDDEDEDDRLATSQDDSDAEISEAAKKRKRRRQQQKAARERAEAERLALLKNNHILKERLDRLEGVTIGHTVTTLDSRIAKMEDDIRKAENIMAQAMEANNGADHMTALRIRDQIKDELRELQGVKRQVTSQSESHAAPEAKQTAVAEQAKNWAQANSAWFDPKGGDEHSKLALQIDAQMTNDGIFDPGTKAYWVELTRRVNAAFSEQDDGEPAPEPQKTAARKGPPVGSGRSTVPATKKNEVYVTPARKAAMQEAGVWDDPVRRQAFLRSYQEYDSRNPASR